MHDKTLFIYLFSDFLWFIAAHQVADYLNTTKESLLMKMAWEMMNPEYKKVMQRKPTAVKKKYPISKTAAPPSKKTFATISLSNTESEKKKGSEEDAPEEDKPVWNKDYITEEANGGEDEFYGGADLEYENQDETEYNEDIIW
ncbi:hypothetical protein YC2023_041938 [Brassica napus]